MSPFFSTRSIRAITGVVVSVLLFLLLANNQGWFSSVASQNYPQTLSSEDDPLSCTRSFDGKKPVTQYVIMMDAGSSGSRIHVYEFSNCAAMPRLVREEFKMIDGGLSSYEDDPQAAAHSLDELLSVAITHVPKRLYGCTPIAVKATAGLRKLGETKSKAILDAVQSHLETNYPFPVVEDGVSIMPGEEEGVYAWVTANYLLEKIGTSDKTPTVAVFDLGGGSTQIVFEPTFKTADKKMSPGDHKFEMSFGGRDFELYQHSYLGYGLNEARAKMNALIVEGQTVSDKLSFVNPCLPPDSAYTAKVLVPDGTAGAEGLNKIEREVTFKGPKEASSLQCRSIAEKILNKDAVCANPPCSFGGVHQPRLFDAFPKDSDMYVFSFFYDRTFPLGMPQSFTIEDLSDLTHKVCAGPELYSSFAALPGAVDTLRENPQWCLELNYMLALLHTGYDIHSSREVRIAKKINNNELGWCLGASLPLLDGKNWKCR